MKYKTARRSSSKRTNRFCNINIKEVPFGIASRVDNIIYINRAIRKFDIELYNALIIHEKLHTSGFTIKDIVIDVSNEEISKIKFSYYLFILTHLSSLSEFLPIWKYDSKWQINLTLVFFYALIILLGGTLWIVL